MHSNGPLDREREFSAVLFFSFSLSKFGPIKTELEHRAINSGLLDIDINIDINIQLNTL